MNRNDPTGLCPECRYQTEEERASVSEMSDAQRIDYYKAQGGAYATMTSLAFAPEMMLLRGAAGVGRGSWALVNESMSARALAFQVSQGGRAGQALVLNGVKFDGAIGKSLMEAKSSMAQFVGKDGAFQPWFKGADGLIDQASRQLAAAGKTPVVWRVQDAKTAGAIGKAFEGAGIKGIRIEVAKPVCTAFVGC
jgi:Restriction endonuclease fold toxin 5